MVAVPNVAPGTAALHKNPVFLYFQDNFQRPNPFRPDIAVDITEVHEQKTSREILLRVVTGLLKRCRRKVFIGYSKFDERGNEREGELRVVFDLLLRSLNSELSK